MGVPEHAVEKHLDAGAAKVPIECSLDGISDVESMQSDLQEEVEEPGTQKGAEQAVPAAKEKHGPTNPLEPARIF